MIWFVIGGIIVGIAVLFLVALHFSAKNYQNDADMQIFIKSELRDKVLWVIGLTLLALFIYYKKAF